MREYEIMTIHRPDLAENDFGVKVEELEAYLSDNGAHVTDSDPWGKRRLAYEIDHLTEGYFTVLTFRSETETVDALDRMVSLADEVVRHKIVRLSEK